MSAQRQKGTGYETYLLPIIRRVWPKAERAAQSGLNDFGDFTNVGGWLLEAKKQETWTLPAWIRTAQQKVKAKGGASPWAILFAKDKRSGIPDMVAMPTETWISQLERVVAQERQLQNAEHVTKKKLAAQAKQYEGKLARAQTKRTTDLAKLTASLTAKLEENDSLWRAELDVIEQANEELQAKLDKKERMHEKLNADLAGKTRAVLSLQSQLRKLRSR